MKTTLITVRLQMVTPGGVTSGELSKNTMKLRTDPHGTPHLPGTTVAGSLRFHCHDYSALSGLFGNEPPHEANESRDDERVASKIQVLGTVYHPTGEPHTRTRTAIDPERGAADNHMLHGIEQLPPGTEFDIMFRWDDPDPDELTTFFEALGSWKPRLGRGISHGAGHCRVAAWASEEYDLATEQGLLAWIQNTDSYPVPTPKESTPAPPDYILDLEYEVVDGVHIGVSQQDEETPEDSAGVSTTEGTGVKISPVLKEKHGDSWHVVVPGSSLKGLMRSRAEYICRVVGADACTDRACGQCWPCRLFGYSNPDKAHRSAVVIHDTIISDPKTECRQHVALDRFTGGAAPQLLYTDEVVVSGRFMVRAEKLRDLDKAEEDLLKAVAADLHDGLIGIGARTTSGQGTVRLTNPEQRPQIADLAEEIAA